jgi:hypothetical protein
MPVTLAFLVWPAVLESMDSGPGSKPTLLSYVAISVALGKSPYKQRSGLERTSAIKEDQIIADERKVNSVKCMHPYPGRHSTWGISTVININA